jgi:hypothetical protein
MKTVLRELKDDIIIEKKLGFITENSCNRILDYIDNLYFEKEKQQIIDFAYGCTQHISREDIEDYYNKTYNKINKPIDKADFKYNGGAGALLCSKCKVIIKIGKDYTNEEKLASRGKIQLPPQYCDKCKDQNK